MNQKNSKWKNEYNEGFIRRSKLIAEQKKNFKQRNDLLIFEFEISRFD